MPNNGSRYEKAILREIESWNSGIEVREQVSVGYRFVNSIRNLDFVLKYNNRYLGIEAKLQESQGTAYQKLSYTIDDCQVSPIPTIIVFHGVGIQDDMKAKLVASGIGLELGFELGATPNEDRVIDVKKLFRQRVYIELGMDWFSI